MVVVFATPPFWFANAMTLAITCSLGAGGISGVGRAWRWGSGSGLGSGV